VTHGRPTKSETDIKMMRVHTSHNLQRAIVTPPPVLTPSDLILIADYILGIECGNDCGNVCFGPTAAFN
jgi:hypothetical protein